MNKYQWIEQAPVISALHFTYTFLELVDFILFQPGQASIKKFTWDELFWNG